MRIQTTRPFDKDYVDLPEKIKERADKQFTLLLENSRHPSLRIKKMAGHPDIWEGSITLKYRFTFQIEGDIYILRRIGEHERVLRKP